MRTEKNEKTSITIPAPLKRRLEARMEKSELSMAETLRRYIEDGLNADDRREGVSRLSIR